MSAGRGCIYIVIEEYMSAGITHMCSGLDSLSFSVPCARACAEDDSISKAIIFCGVDFGDVYRARSGVEGACVCVCCTLRDQEREREREKKGEVKLSLASARRA